VYDQERFKETEDIRKIETTESVRQHDLTKKFEEIFLTKKPVVTEDAVEVTEEGE
jgi:hypothetical protein